MVYLTSEDDIESQRQVNSSVVSAWTLAPERPSGFFTWLNTCWSILGRGRQHHGPGMTGWRVFSRGQCDPRNCIPPLPPPPAHNLPRIASVANEGAEMTSGNEVVSLGPSSGSLWHI